MFIVKRKRGSSARSSKSSLSQQHESDGSSHNSNPCSLATGSVKLKSILRKERIDDETPSKSSSGNQSNSQYYCKRVGFKHIHVREFERIIGDNPSCSSGAPIAIGWAHDHDRTMLIDEYEEARPPRKQLPQLVLTRQDREEILVEWGASYHDIIDSIRANVKAKNQRRRTVSSLDRYDRFEEYMETASRKLKRTLLLKKPVSKQAEEMADQSTRFSRVTYEDRPPQQPQQQRLVDIPPRQPPRPPESPRPPSLSDHDLRNNENPYDDLDLMEDNFNGEHALEEQAPSNSCQARERPPAPMIEIDRLEDDGSGYFDQCIPIHLIGEGDQTLQFYQHNQMVHLQSLPQELQNFYHLQMVPHHQHILFDAESAVLEDLTYDGDETDGFDSLGQTYYEDDGMDAPGVRKQMAAVIISEDGQYEAGEAWDNGFTLQPPPFSDSIISSWE